MADAHEGMSLSLKANFAQVNEAKKATQALNSAFGELQRRANSLHMSTNFPREINHIDTVTASYVRRLESEGKTYEANQQKVKAYQGAISKLSAEQSRLQSALSRTTSSTDKASDAYRSQQIKLNQTTAEINKFKAGIKSAQSEMDRLHPTGFNRWVKGADEVNKAATTMKSKLHSAWDNIRGGATVAAAGIGAVGAAAFSGAKQSAEIQQRYREINNLAVLGGEKQKEVTKSITEMQRQGRDMSIKYGKSQQEIAAGYEDLVKRGYTTKQAVGALKTELQASVASGDKFSDVTTVSSQVLDAFGMRANSTGKMLSNTRKVVNELAYSADATSTGFGDLGTAMSYVGTAAKSNNVSLAETASALGVLSNNGLESDKAGTALRATINGLTNQVNKIGSKNSIFTKLGIKKSEMVDAHGNLKGLSQDMAVLYKHIEEHSKGGSDQNGFFKSIFGTTGMNGAMILAKSSKEVEDLTKRTEKAGKTGKYVSELAAKNMGTAQGSANSARQAMNAFKMTLGNAVLPAINEASNSLAKFLLSKDGKKFQKDVGGAVAKVANGLVKLIKWTATHKREVKWIGYGILAGYSISKGLKFISFLGQVKKGLEAIKAIKFVGGLFSKVTGGEKAAGTITKLGGALPKERGGAGILTGALQSAKSAGGFKKLSTAGKLANGAAGVGVALDAGSQFVNAYKDRHNADKRSQDIGQGIGSAIGGGIGMYFGGPLGAMVGSQLGKVAGKWGGTAVNNFTKGWQKHKPPKNFWSMENLGWSTHNMFKNLPSALNKTGKRIKSWASGVGRNIHKGWDKGMKASHSFFKNLPKNMSQTGKALQRGWNQTWKKVNNNRYVKAFKQGEFIQTASKDIQSRWKSFSTDFGKKWNAGWKSFNNARYVKAFKKGEFFSTALKDIQSRWKSFSTDFGKKWNDFWDRLSKGWNNFWGKAGDIRKGITNNIKGFANSIAYGSGHSKHTFKYEKIKSHANGGAMHSTHGALVGEAGPELAYKPYANHVRLLGANGPQFTKVHAGEHLLNARDTAKVLNGGLGNGLTLKGYASGTDKLGKTSKKVTNDYKQIADKSSKSLNSLSKKSSSAWNKITRQTGKDSSKTRKRAISDYSDMHKGIVKQMDKTHDGVISLSESTAKGFGKALGKTKGYAKDAMSDMIGQVNKGISGIDKVLGQFGGNTSVIKPVKFATGTDPNGRLTQDTLAMVNDAQTGPRQEALVSDKNELFLPRGNNVTMMLPKGWGVLNGTQTQQVAKSAGVKHFAKGSGLSHSALRKLAEKAGANPAQSFKEMFLDKLKPSGSNLKRGSIGLAQNSSQHFGNPWSNAMWTVINDAIGDSSKNAKGLLKAVEKNGEGHKYVWGAAGPSTFDCSGLVMYTLKHDYGIDYPHFSGSQYARTQHISKKDARMGDLVFWGPGDHVGVYAGGNKYFSAESPSQGIHMNTLSSVVGHGSPMFGRVKGIKNDSSKATRKNTADKALINLAKHELGASALKWIKDKLGDEMGSLSNPSGDGVARWRSVIERAARVMHVTLSKADLAHILNVTAHESGGNPKAVNGWDSNAKAGTPSKGVIQFIQPTFDHYAVKGHHNILNGYDQYLAMFNDKTWRRDLTLGGWGPTGAVRGYAKGGRPKAHTPFIAGERGPELITADCPVKVDSHEQTKRKVSDLAQMFKFPKINRPTRSNGSAPVININFNGPIYGTKEEAKRIAELVRREINKVLVNIGDEFGTDPSLY